MPRLSPHHHELRRRFPSLAAVGVAAEFFPAYRSPRHDADLTHDTLYCSLLLAGRATHHVGDQTIAETAGHLTVVAPGTGHQIVTGSTPVTVFNLYLDPERHPFTDVPDTLAQHLADLLPVHPGLTHRLNRLLSVRLEDPPRTAGWLHAIVAEQQRNDVGAHTALLALLRLVLVDLARAAGHQRGIRRAGASDDPAMESIRRDLDTHFAEAVPITRLAARARLSPEHLARRFARYTGLPPARYRQVRRLHAAMTRLRTSDERILDIALTCGFADLAHFNRSFKALAGCTPRAYRTRLRA